MRKRSFIISAFAVVATIAAVSSAAPPSSNPKIRPAQPPVPKQITRAPFIAGVKHAGRAWSEGPVQIEIEIKNTQATPLQTNLLLDRMIRAQPAAQEGGRIGSVPVQVPANASAKVTIADSRGISACEATFDRVTLEGVPSATTFVKLEPSCIFSARVINPNDGLAPDRLASQMAGKVFYESAFIPTRQPKCGMFVTFEATLKNRSSRATRANLKVISPEGEPSFTPNSVEVAAGGERPDQRAGAKFRGSNGRWRLEIDAPGAPTWQPGVQAEVTRLCSITAELASTVAPPPSPPRPDAPGPE